jgi:hypothetical protein
VVKEGVREGGGMTQTLYAHMNKKNKEKIKGAILVAALEKKKERMGLDINV